MFTLQDVQNLSATLESLLLQREQIDQALGSPLFYAGEVAITRKDAQLMMTQWLETIDTLRAITKAIRDLREHYEPKVKAWQYHEEWEQRIWMITTRIAHHLKAVEIAKSGQSEKLRFGWLPFKTVAMEAGVSPDTVSHWYSLEHKRFITPALAKLMDYYGVKDLRSVSGWILPSGVFVSLDQL